MALAKKPTGKSKFSLKGEKSKILLVGGGKMGSALLSGWLKEGLDRKNILVVEPEKRAQSFIEKKLKIRCFAQISEIGKFSPTIILFAVKPQYIAGILPYYQQFKKALFISIAAGITIDFLKKYLGSNVRIIRAMPNLPATIGEGVTVFSYKDNIGAKYHNIAIKLFDAVGKTYWAEERYINLVTALSGSGPAYVFLLAECLLEAARDDGLPEALENIILHTLKGGALMAFDSDKPVSVLREEVTSKGGTTEAALNVLNKDNAFKNLIKAAVTAASERAEALSK